MKSLVFLSVILIFLAYVAADELEKRATCPGGGNCNGKGSCGQDGKCTCYQGWAGDDCSYGLLALQSGVGRTNQHVGRGQWLFFTINSTAGSGLVVVVNQTSIGGDCDIYLLQNQPPTRSNYFKKDTSTNQNVALVVDNAGANIWYIGVYGFLDTYFSIRATVTGQCASLNGCSGNGQCVNNQCVCNSGWSGIDCSQGVNQLQLGVPVSGFVTRGQWMIYTLTVTSNNLLQVIVNETVANGDVDLYVKFDSVPTMWNYDYLDTSLQRNFEIDINSPRLGTWYFGLYGYRNTSYLLTVKTSLQCPSRCSLHGTCQGSSCACYSQFSGVYCENMNTDLTLGLAQVGYVGDASWNYYKFRPNTGNNLQVLVSQVGSGDCDLYAQVGRNPTRTDYSAKDVGIRANATLTIQNPGTQYWYFGVFGFSACQYTISVFVNSVCPGNPPCSNHGRCNSGICVCDQGYTGAACNKTGNYLTNGVTVSSQNLPLLSWQYYSINVVNTTYLVIDMSETSTVGFVWLFASRGNIPDLRNYDYSDQETNSKNHRIQITFTQPQTATWQIGVYGNPFADRGPLSYSLAAWYAPY